MAFIISGKHIAFIWQLNRIVSFVALPFGLHKCRLIQPKSILKMSLKHTHFDCCKGWGFIRQVFRANEFNVLNLIMCEVTR